MPSGWMLICVGVVDVLLTSVACGRRPLRVATALLRRWRQCSVMVASGDDRCAWRWLSMVEICCRLASDGRGGVLAS